MSYTLVIVESPAKCNKIESYLGEGYKCAASFGHIRELADGLKSIDVANNFNPTFKECEDKKQQIAKLRKLIESAKEVLLASDDDREGEAIAWHLCQVFGLPVKTTKRIVFHEITETALKRAVAEATTLNMHVVNAQLSRQVLDVLVGYKLSPVLWKYITKCKKTGLSAGRCQTPALRLVYENQKEIEASPGKKVYTTTGYFTAHNLPFVLNYNHEGNEEMSTFLEKSVNFNHIYSCTPIRTTIKPPPTPFTTSTLQQTANNELRISPKETMKICQTLYEGGYITYMRTDSTTYSEEFIEKTILYIDKTYGKEYIHQRFTASGDEKEKEIKEIKEIKENKEIKEIKKKEKKNKKVENEVKPQAAHEAIRPTDIQLVDLKDEKMTAKEIKMYALIRRNTLESCMSPATYNGFTAVVGALPPPPRPQVQAQQLELDPDCKRRCNGWNCPEYRYAVEQPIFKGWKIVEGVEDNKEFNYLQALAHKNTTKEKECILKYKKITAKVTMKDLKSHLSESKLVQLLEQNGIGRPSTFSSLIDKIQERGYVKLDNVKGVAIKCSDYELEGDELSEIEVEREFGNEKNKLVIQPTGIIVLEFLLQHFDSLFQYDYTKHMEDSLDLIANGTKLWHELCRECLEQITTLTNDLTIDKTSPNGGLGVSPIDKTSPNGGLGVPPIDKTPPTNGGLGVQVDNHHVYMIGKYGPVLKCTFGDKISFKPVIETVNIDKLKRGEYTLEELVVENKLTGHFLGMYDNKEVHLKNGKFGYYVEYGDMKKSVRIGLKQPTEVTLDDIADVLFDSTSEEAFSRIITTDLSIRNGKFGDYIFYKTKTMKKPQFLKLKGFKEDYKTCELSILIKWIKETYKI
jgi:DNA topoisomerase-1